MSDFIKMQKYALLRDLKKQTWEKKMFQEKIFPKHVSDKGLLFEYTIKETNNN